MNPSLPILMSTISLLSGCSDDEGLRSTAQLTEVETTTQRGSTTTIQRSEIRYEGSRLREVLRYENGAPAGTARFTYGTGGITQIDYADAEGDRANDTLTYESGRLVRTRYEVPGVHVDERTIAYANGQPKEIATRTTASGGGASMHLVRFEYDAAGRASKRLEIEGSSTESTELRYTPDGLVERASLFDGGEHQETYAYSFTPDRRLDEVTDTRNGRHEVTYDGEGRIAEIRWATSAGTTTHRYTYGADSVDGWAFAPAVPVPQLFDLTGAAYDSISLLHGSIEIPRDIARAASMDDGDGDGDGATCSFVPQDACDTCLEAWCCEETEACQTGTACYSYYQCGAACETQECVAVCGETNPTGRADFDDFRLCGQANCPASCGS